MDTERYRCNTDLAAWSNGGDPVFLRAIPPATSPPHAPTDVALQRRSWLPSRVEYDCWIVRAAGPGVAPAHGCWCGWGSGESAQWRPTPSGPAPPKAHLHARARYLARRHQFRQSSRRRASVQPPPLRGQLNGAALPQRDTCSEIALQPGLTHRGSNFKHPRLHVPASIASLLPMSSDSKLIEVVGHTIVQLTLRGQSSCPEGHR
jgi:hypothetical protein